MWLSLVCIPVLLSVISANKSLLLGIDTDISCFSQHIFKITNIVLDISPWFVATVYSLFVFVIDTLSTCSFNICVVSPEHLHSHRLGVLNTFVNSKIFVLWGCNKLFISCACAKTIFSEKQYENIHGTFISLLRVLTEKEHLKLVFNYHPY